jgi:hypothetical protein
MRKYADALGSKYFIFLNWFESNWLLVTEIPGSTLDPKGSHIMMDFDENELKQNIP